MQEAKFSVLSELFLISPATLYTKILTYILVEKKPQTNKTTQQKKHILFDL